MMMNEAMPMSTMLTPFDSPHITPMYEPRPQSPKRFFPFRMPRVVKDQKLAFDTNEIFKKHARDNEHIIYTRAYLRKKIDNKDVDDKLRQEFVTECKKGCTEIVFTSSGIVLQINFTPPQGGLPSYLDFNKEPGKAHIRSQYLILNGVCVRLKGVMDLQSLQGIGCLEFDEESARIEDALASELHQWGAKIKEFSATKRGAFKISPFSSTSSSNIKVE